MTKTLEERIMELKLVADCVIDPKHRYLDEGVKIITNYSLKIISELQEQNKSLLDLTAAQEIMGCLKEENEKLRANNEKLCEIAREAKSKTTGNILAALNLNSFIKPTPPKD